MKKKLLLVCLWIVSIGIASESLDIDKIDQVPGLKRKLNEKEGVYKSHFRTQPFAPFSLGKARNRLHSAV